jgi:hypothetical protein
MPGAAFRKRLTEEKCLDVWKQAFDQALQGTQQAIDSGNEAIVRARAIGGYAGEGIQVSIKQMAANLLPVDVDEQEKYIELLRMRSRQVWDECKHSKLHVDVLLEKGWIQNEKELMDIPEANTNGLPSYFGQGMMFQHVHPLARAAQNYFQEANACLGITAALSLLEDPIVRHENLSQRDEELYHFMEGKYQIDAYCDTPENQKAVEDWVDWLRYQMWGFK